MTWWTPATSLLAVAISGAVTIWGHPPHRRVIHRLAKMATMALIIATTITFASTGDHTYVALIRGALWLSLFGDVFLMLEDRWFFHGLVAFFLALITYAAAMATQADLGWQLSGYLLYPLVPALFVLGWLWSGLGRLRPAVVLYVGAMTTLVLVAIARAATADLPRASGLAGIGGALLFMTSDTLVARRRFVAPAAPYAVELGTYFAAQWLLAATTWLA
jgi:uncharacterized membrane protein YhhN